MKRIKLSPGSDDDNTNQLVSGHRSHSTSKLKSGDQQIQPNELRKREQKALELLPCGVREMNPLKIDLVLEILFSFCSVKTLKNCRLVSKQWKDVSLKAWRNKAVLCTGRKAAGLPNIRKYLKMLESKYKRHKALQLNKYPFKNFQIRALNLKYVGEPVYDVARHVILSNFKGSLSQFNEFLSKFHSLESLTLENFESPENEETPLLSTNIKRLKISSNKDHYGSRSWDVVLDCFKNLEVLSIEFRAAQDFMFSFVREILSDVEAIKRVDENALPLNELEILHTGPEIPSTSRNSLESVDFVIIAPIVVCQFPLERLTFHVVWEKIDLAQSQVHPIFRLLDSCKETLQHLKTSFIFNADEETIRLHLHKTKVNAYELRMDSLKEVHLSNGLLGLNILQGLDLPNLKKLVVNDEECVPEIKIDDIKDLEFSFPQGRVYGNLITLEFLDNRKIIEAKTIRTFARIMPNLVHLTMPLDKLTFGIVCESFKGLKTLNALAAQCRYDTMDDESLTGISKEMDHEVPRKPNITDLIHLTDLSIACEENVLFTDHSVVHGLLHLPCLHSLSIGFQKLSDENKAKLVRHVKGYVDIKVKTPSMPDSYCDFDVDTEHEHKI